MAEAQPTHEFTRNNIPAIPDFADSDAIAAPHRPQAPHGSPPTARDGTPRFEIVAKKRADGSYHNVEYVTILVPGDNKAAPRMKVSDGLREKYRYWYDRWRAGLETRPDGTPLEMWPALEGDPALIMTFRVNNLFTVEQVRDCPDAFDTRIPMFSTWKRKAREYLDLRKDQVKIEKQDAENQALKRSIQFLQQQIAEINAKASPVAQSTTTNDGQGGTVQAPGAKRPAQKPTAGG